MKKLLFTFIIALPLLSIGQAKKLYRQALRTTNLEERIKLLNQVIEEEPKNLDAYFHRGIAKNDLGDYRGAIVDYSKIIVDEPDADTYFNRGNSRYSIKDFSGAKQDYAKALMLDKNFIDAQYSLAFANYDLGEYEEAISGFDELIKNSPMQPQAYIMRASAHKALEHYKTALDDYSMAIRLEPNAHHYFLRGSFLMEIKYYKEANLDLTRSIRINKNSAYSYFYRGASHLFLGKFEDSVSDFLTAIKFDSMDFDAYLGLAMAYNKMNDTANAKKSYDKANSILFENEAVNNVDQYSNTYWYENEYYYFNNNLNLLNKL